MVISPIKGSNWNGFVNDSGHDPICFVDCIIDIFLIVKTPLCKGFVVGLGKDVDGRKQCRTGLENGGNGIVLALKFGSTDWIVVSASMVFIAPIVVAIGIPVKANECQWT